MKRNLIAAALFGAAMSSFVHADDTMVIPIVTPTRLAETADKTIADTTVITSDDIHKSLAPDVPTLLRNVVGLEVAQPGGPGKAASLFLRGANSDQVLVLVDGVRMNSATTGMTAVDQLMTDQIERIEVVRGNVSSLYGSEAIGGVVQIFTRRGRGTPALNVSAGMGSLGTQRLSAGIGGAADENDFAVQLSSYKTDGVSALDPALVPRANPDRDGYRNNSLSANAGHAFNADHRVSASLYGSYGSNQYDSGFGLPGDVHVNREQMWKLALASEDQITETWHSKVQVANGVDQYRDYLNGQPTAYFGRPSSLFQTSSNQLLWQNGLRLDEHNRLLLGAESLRQRVSTDIEPGYLQNARTVNSLFAGYTGHFGAHQVQANLRQDRNSQYGNANTWLLGYGFEFAEAWRATASYSTAFKAPTFNDLYYPNYGNAALKPEHARNAEAGLHYHSGGQRFDAVYFDSRISDLVNPVLVDPVNFVYQAQNVNRARIDGLELSYAGQFGDTGVTAGITAQNPRDAATGVQLDRRAKARASLAVSQQLGAWQVGAEWLHSEMRPDASNTRALTAYNVLNLTAGYAFSRQMKLTVRADNLSKQNNADAYGYNSLGRRVFASINYLQ